MSDNAAGLSATTGFGNEIRVGPDTLEAAGRTVMGIATQAMSIRAGLVSQDVLPSACDPAASGACEEMLSALSRQMGLLSEASLALAHKITGATLAYVLTDAHQMGGPSSSASLLGPARPGD